MLRIECPCSDMILICACIRMLVLSLAINWFPLQLAKVASFVASLRKRRGPPEMGWVRSVKSVSPKNCSKHFPCEEGTESRPKTMRIKDFSEQQTFSL